MLSNLGVIIDNIKNERPLIHHITNYVTANDSANITLAVGASPVMASEVREAAEMTSHAAALVLNIGTLQAATVESMIAAGHVAAHKGIPVIFDPVGVGATAYRTEVAQRILSEVKPHIIRGNLSEVTILSGVAAAIKGVDSLADEASSEAVAAALARKLGCVVAVTGKVDVVASPDHICRIANGHAMLTNVTGTGCMTSTLVGCCCAVADYFSGTVAGVAMMGMAGEFAQRNLQAGEGAGSFRMRLFDATSNLNAALFNRHIRLDGLRTNECS